MLKKTINLVRKCAGACVGKIRAKVFPQVKVKLTRKNLFITLSDVQGGALHVLPRPGSTQAVKFDVQRGNDLYLLQMTSDGATTMPLATFSTEREAKFVLKRINKALTGNPIFKYIGWALLAWLAWLFWTSYQQVTAGANNHAENAAAAFTPPPSPAPQTMPSAAAAAGADRDLANYIYQQAMAAKDKAEHDTMPPKSGTETANLESFGLSSGGQASGQSGPGCDPSLAFKVSK